MSGKLGFAAGLCDLRIGCGFKDISCYLRRDWIARGGRLRPKDGWRDNFAVLHRRWLHNIAGWLHNSAASTSQPIITSSVALLTIGSARLAGTVRYTAPNKESIHLHRLKRIAQALPSSCATGYRILQGHIVACSSINALS